MSKWKEKGKLLDAWRNDDGEPQPPWLLDAIAARMILPVVGSKGFYYDVRTPDGLFRADYGDWIVRLRGGTFWRVTPDLFAVTYEPPRCLT